MSENARGALRAMVGTELENELVDHFSVTVSRILNVKHIFSLILSIQELHGNAELPNTLDSAASLHFRSTRA
jgi:hypothetical protein